MKKIHSILIAFLWLILWSSACKPYVPIQPLDIVSFKEYFPEIEEAAKKWDKDAYFVEANIPIYLPSEKNELWLIRASFQSPIYDNLSLLVDLGIDGKIKTEIVGHTTPIVHITPIRVDDWKIDSPEAVTLLDGTRSAGNSFEGRDDVFLFLERRIINSQSHVVWRLTMVKEGSHLYLDAISGEELSPAE